ncbi:MAG: DUF72 domain-containing protein [Peptococcaceae bacterium]|nr:MAG: DUF72 domain-containing protein [Peptococcaceae bacterium]
MVNLIYATIIILRCPEEIQEWVPGIKDLSKEAKRVFVAFNNHYRGQAVQNARMLRELLNL